MKPRLIRNILITSRFRHSWRLLNKDEKLLAEIREQIFRQNAFDPRLKTHKLKGKLKALWSFSITYSYRVLFEFLSSDSVTFHDIGTHDIYR